MENLLETGSLAEGNIKISDKIFSEQLALLFQHLYISISANLFCSTLILAGFHHAITQSVLWAWYGVMITTCAFRIGILLFYRKFPQYEILHLMLFFIGVFITSVLWGIMGSILMPSDLLYQVIIIIIVACLTSGVPQALQGSLIASFGFMILTILPMIIWAFMQETYTYFLLSMALSGYLFFMLAVARHSYYVLKKMLTLQYENLSLTNNLLNLNKTLQASETRFHSSFDYAAIGMALVSPEGKFLKVNKSFCQLTAYNEEELYQMDFQTITYPEDLNENLQKAHQLLAGEIDYYQMKKRYIRKTGELIWVFLSVSLMRNPENNQPLYFLTQIQNIDARVHAEEQLKHIAYHDSLTGLANRKLLEISFEIATRFSQRHNCNMALLFMDLDRFKTSNDTYGHECGDNILKVVAQRLSSLFRKTDIVARLGGDEIVMVLSEVIDENALNKLLNKIQAAVSETIIIDGNEIHITSSIGISLYPQDGVNLDTLIKKADEALYFVKQHGRNNFKFYSRDN